MTGVPDGLLRAVADRYRVEREIGSGGMATVYLAHDLRHGRRVAIKVLRSDLAETLGPERFTREIEIAAALTHPHIVPLHDSGSAEGLLFYVMPFVEGDSLKERLQREGALPVADALRIFREIVDALGAAHAHGVVHRDVKPSNVLLAGDHALVADFGVAKAASDATGARQLTTMGVALGTPQYMAPEQATADPAMDHRADLFAAGTIAYEMLTGTSPFEAQGAPAVFAALMTKVPEHPSRVRAEVPAALGDLVLWCLEKSPDARPQTASELLRRLDAALTPPTGVPPAPPGSGRRGRPRLGRGIVAAGIALLLLVSLGVWRALARVADVRWARQQALPEVLRLVGENRAGDAADLAFEVERILGDDRLLGPLWPRITTPFRVVTDPPGAEILYRRYASADTAWSTLGVSPWETDRFPMGAFRFRLTLEGHEPVEVARSFLSAEWLHETSAGGFDYRSDPSYALRAQLVRAGSGPPGMVRVEGGRFLAVPMVGSLPIEPVEVPTFWIDRTEVTNAEYRAFVEAGAYADSTFWPEPFLLAGAGIPWGEAVATLVDATGRPGPSTWVLEQPPEGQGSLPVGGVSWYEAAAYCHWQGRSLPTLFHWALAAVPSSDAWVPFHPVLTAASNFDSDGPVGVGARDAIGTSGAQDLAGNVREWVSTSSGEDRRLVGGAWNDPEYAIRDRVAASPWTRLPTDGFRCALYPDGAPPEHLLRSVDLPPQDLTRPATIPDEVFDASRSLYAYDRARPLAVREDSTRTAEDGVTIQWVSVDVPYGGRLSLRLHIPTDAPPPYGAVLFVPGGDVLYARTMGAPKVRFLARAGWVLVEPVLDGTYQRNDGLTAQRLQSPASSTELFSHWVQDLGRAIDYLEQRPDVDASAVAYAGLSFGAGVSLFLLPHEPRFRGAILYSGGLAPTLPQEGLDRRMAMASRMTLPVLMLGGRNDFTLPVANQEALLRALGTPDDMKTWLVYDAAHWPLPMNEVIRETVDFLDRYVASGPG